MADQAKAAQRANKKEEGDEDASAPQQSAPYVVIDGIMYSVDENSPSPSFSFAQLDKGGSSELDEAVKVGWQVFNS
jgi:hypothetical protein